MSFFTEIKNFIKTEVLGIQEINTKISPAQKKDNKPIIECKTEVPEDTFAKKTKETSNTKETLNHCSVKAMEETIANIPTTTVNLKQMIKDGLLEKITGLSKETLEKLPNQKKKLLFDSVQNSVSKYEDLKAKGKISKDINIEAIIVADATNTYQAISTGVFKNVQEYEKATSDINKELGNDFDKSPVAERRAEFKRRKTEYKQRFEEELEESKKLPKEKQSSAVSDLIQRYKFIMRKQFLDISAQKSTETAVDAALLLEAEDMEYGAKTIIETRINEEEKTKAANYADYNFTKEVIQSNTEAGDRVKAKTLKGYTQTYMEYKSAETAYEYQTAYASDRKAYETALQKQQNGEELTPEEQVLLRYMSTEYYTASAQGIGQGILNNINMTNEQKVEFLSVWENDAKQFSDYDLVTSEVKKVINENPAYKTLKEKIEEIQSVKNAEEQTGSKEKSNSQTGYFKQEIETVRTKYSSNTSQTFTRINNTKVSKKNNTTDTKITASNKQARNVTTTSSIISNPITIAKNIKEEGIEIAIKKYGSDAIQMILDNSGLKHLRSRLTTIVRSYDLNTLISISKSCSDSSFIYICSIVNSDYVEKLKENREISKGLCYIAEKQVQKLEGKNAVV